jgi:hypothetical protein
MNNFEWLRPSQLGRSNLITLTFYYVYAIDMIETYSWKVALNLNLLELSHSLIVFVQGGDKDYDACLELSFPL